MAEIALQRDFIGVNKQKPPTNIGPNEASEVKNVVFNNDRVEKRRGSVRLSPYVIKKPAIRFDGTQWLATPDIPSATYSGAGYLHGVQWTQEIVGWIESGTSTQTHAIVERGWSPTAQADGWALGFQELDKTFVYQENLSADNDIAVTGTWTNFSTRKPFHLAIRRTGTLCYMWLKDAEFEGVIGSVNDLTAGATEDQVAAPVLFGTGFVAGDGEVYNLTGRLQEYRSWTTEIATATIQAYAFKELPSYATSGILFHHKMNEGTGDRCYDYGKVADLTTVTYRYAAVMQPSRPSWVSGLVHGGLGDKAVKFDGKDDYFGVPVPNDEYATLRTGTVAAWSVQANVRPREQMEDDGVFLMYGAATYTIGTEGFAYKIYSQVDHTLSSYKFKAEFCFSTETQEVLWSTNYTHGNIYGLNIQRSPTEVRLRVDDLTDDIVGTWKTAAVACQTAPSFPVHHQILGAATYPPSSSLVAPSSGFAHTDISEVRIWDGIRHEPQTITYAYPRDNDLIGYWKFNEGGGGIISDVSTNLNQGYVLPDTDAPDWASGLVTPIEGPEITGLFYYQQNANLISLNDSRDRTLLACAGGSIYRNEGGPWNSLVEGRTQGELNTGAQLENHLVVCNAIDDNVLYDGDATWPVGVASPQEPVSPSTYAITTQTWSSHTVWDVYNGQNRWTAWDLDRHEPSGTFNGKRVSVSIGGSTGTVDVRCKYFINTTTVTLNAMGTTTDDQWLHINGQFWGVNATETYALEGARLLSAGVKLGTPNTVFTHTYAIVLDTAPDSGNSNKRIVYLDTATTADYFLPNRSKIIMYGHFLWDAQSTETFLKTSSYQISLYDGGVTGNYFYRYTNYNKYTDVESNPSPPSDTVVAPTNNAVNVQIPYSTDTNVTDRLVYRTKRDGAQRGENYFLLGTYTGTGTGTFGDLTPAGDEGRLISFYRDVAPKSSICKVFKGRMWYVPVKYPNRVYFSAPLNASEVDPYNWLPFGDSNDYITALGISGDSLVVFKRRSVWLLSRSDLPQGAIPYRISDSVGCVSHHTVKEVNGETLFLSESGIYSLRGTSIRKVSGSKVQWWIDRTDRSRLHKAVACDLWESGIYRINLSPAQTNAAANNVAYQKNSWYLDYHYQRSRDHTPFFEPVWSAGDREVSFYGDYVSEENTYYNAYGDYRGFVYLDNWASAYTDGQGWSRGSTVAGTFVAAGEDHAAGTYTLNVGSALPTDGDGLKGLPVWLLGSNGTESAIVLANTTNTIELTSPTTLAYDEDDKFFIAPIPARYKSGWMDYGSTLKDKRVTSLKIDYKVESTTSTLTVGVNIGRTSSDRGVVVNTHTMDLSSIAEKFTFRGRGKHIQLDLQHDWPGESFEIYNWEFLAEPGRSR